MANQVIYKKRFVNKLDKLLEYLEKKGPAKTASHFLDNLDNTINAIKINPHIGIKTKLYNTRGILITKHNKLYYRVDKDKIVVLNMIDTRRNPQNNPFTKNK